MSDCISIESLKESGFLGFVSVQDLTTENCGQVSQQPGVYIVIRSVNSPPDFSSTSPGGHFKGKNPTVPTQELNTNWVDGASVVYIGKAGGSNSSATLKKRLRQYMQFGSGRLVGHWGGRYIWQLADYASLLVCWRPTAPEEPADVETRLLRGFQAVHGKRPFANLRD